MDRWILSSLNSLVQSVETAMNDYEPTEAGRLIEDFVDAHLSNWYVRLSRRRYWKPSRAITDSNEADNDKLSAYQTLYDCLETLSRLMAPIAPFFADWLFTNLNSITRRYNAASVHHIEFPHPGVKIIDNLLEERMQLAQEVSSLILSLRKKVNIKVRQPLQKALVPAMGNELSDKIRSVENIIKAETNIKEIEILTADNSFIRRKAKANFKTLGKRLGSRMKWAAEQIQNFKNIEIEKVQQGNYLLNRDRSGDEEAIYIEIEDIEITTDQIPGYEVASKGILTVALDITISDNLKREGYAREFVNRVQNLRKDLGLEVTDRILVKVSENEGFKASINEYNNYICAEILADKLEFVSTISEGTEIEVNDVILILNVIKKEISYDN